MPRIIRLVAAPLIGIVLSSCNQPTATEPAELTASPEPSPSVVGRAGPTMTADAAAIRLAPLPSDVIPDVVIPGGAELIEYVEPTESSDARADYLMPDSEASEIRNWFREQMPEVGWDEPTTRDGALIFIHSTQLSQRFAREGLRRTATVVFDESDEALTITLIVEEPIGAADRAGDDDAEDAEVLEGDAAEDAADNADEQTEQP